MKSTIAVYDEDKLLFDLLLAQYAANESKSISQAEFFSILLKKFEGSI